MYNKEIEKQVKILKKEHKFKTVNTGESQIEAQNTFFNNGESQTEAENRFFNNGESQTEAENRNKKMYSL